MVWIYIYIFMYCDTSIYIYIFIYIYTYIHDIIYICIYICLVCIYVHTCLYMNFVVHVALLRWSTCPTASVWIPPPWGRAGPGVRNCSGHFRGGIYCGDFLGFPGNLLGINWDLLWDLWDSLRFIRIYCGIYGVLLGFPLISHDLIFRRIVFELPRTGEFFKGKVFKAMTFPVSIQCGSMETFFWIS